MNNGVVRDRDNNFSRHQTFKDGVTIEGGLTADIIGGSNAEETADFTAEAGKVYIVDTSSAAITATLPASPAALEEVTFMDGAKTFNTNALTVNTNGKKLDGATVSTKVHTTKGGAFKYIYRNATYGWLLKAFIFMLFTLNAHAGDFAYEMNSWEQDSGLSIGTDKLKPRTAGELLSIADSAGTTVATITTSAMTITTASIGTLDASTSQIGTLSLTDALSVANGGTGLSELAAGRIPYGDVANPLASDSNFTYSDKALTQYRYRRTNSDAISIPTGGTYYKIATIEPTVGNNSGSRIVITVNANCRWNSNNSRQTAVFVYAVGRDTIQLIKASTNVYGGLGSIPIPEVSGGVITIAARNAASTTSGEAYVFVEEYASLAAFAEINFLTPTDVGDSSAFLADDCEFFLHKIGINETSPQRKLHIKDEINPQMRLEGASGAFADFNVTEKNLEVTKDIKQPNYRNISTTSSQKNGTPSTYDLTITLSSATNTARIGGKFTGLLIDNLSYAYTHFFSFDFLIRKLTTGNVECSVGNLTQIDGTAPTIDSIAVTAFDTSSATITVTMTSTVYGSLLVSKGVISAYEAAGSIASAEWE